MRLANAAATAVLGVVVLAAVAGAFTKNEKAVIAQLRAADVALGERLDALEEPTIRIADPTVTRGPIVNGTTYIDVEWDVSPCSTGQVQYGPTLRTVVEKRLLCHHRQRITGLDPEEPIPDLVIWSSDGWYVASSASIVISPFTPEA